jgi:hypothetical protein
MGDVGEGSAVASTFDFLRSSFSCSSSLVSINTTGGGVLSLFAFGFPLVREKPTLRRRFKLVSLAGILFFDVEIEEDKGAVAAKERRKKKKKKTKVRRRENFSTRKSETNQQFPCSSPVPQQHQQTKEFRRRAGVFNKFLNSKWYIVVL